MALRSYNQRHFSARTFIPVWGEEETAVIQTGGGPDESDEEAFNKAKLEHNRRLYEKPVAVEARAPIESVDEIPIRTEETTATEIAGPSIQSAQALAKEDVERAKIEAKAKRAIEERLEEQKKQALLLAAYDEFF